MTILMAALSLVLAAATTPGATRAPSPSPSEAPVTSDRPAGPTRFKCQAGGDVTARFASRDERLIAVVDAGDGPHDLTYAPWTGGPVKLTWSDGQRTLTWSPGVQIMWVDGPAHRMCGRGEHKH